MGALLAPVVHKLRDGLCHLQAAVGVAHVENITVYHLAHRINQLVGVAGIVKLCQVEYGDRAFFQVKIHTQAFARFAVVHFQVLQAGPAF